MPHVPLHASERFAGSSRRGLYGDVVETVDWSVGQIVDALEQTGAAENTVVLFTSDNGPWLREKQNGGSAGLLREGKGTSYEGGFRVPGIVRWPARVARGQVRSDLVTSLDVLPTFLEIAGVKPPAAQLDGRSVLPLLEGKPPADDPPRRFFYYQGALLEAVREGRWKLRQSPIMDNPSSQQALVVAALERTQVEHRTFTRAQALGVEAPPQLFDLEADPAETINQCWDPALSAIRTDLIRQLLAWQELVGDPFAAATRAAFGAEGEHL
jgi:arylsulfatase